MDKKKRKGLIILILGFIIILITICVMIFVFAPLGSWSYGEAQLVFYLFISIGAIITLVGLGYLIIQPREKMEKTQKPREKTQKTRIIGIVLIVIGVPFLFGLFFDFSIFIGIIFICIGIYLVVISRRKD